MSLNVFGGKGKEDSQFLNAHGICYDNRDKKNPSLLVSGRELNVLKRFSLDGKYMSSYKVPGALICRPVIHKKDIYFAVLKSKESPNSDSGFLLIINENNEVVSCPGATAPSYENNNLANLHQTIRLFQHPHDVCVDDVLAHAMHVVVCRPLTLSYRFHGPTSDEVARPMVPW